MKKNISQISGILVLIFIVISCSTEPVHITLLNPPGALTDNSITLIWEHDIAMDDPVRFTIHKNGEPAATVEKVSFHRLTDLSPDSVYSFLLTVHNKNNKLIGKSNAVIARTKPISKILNIKDFGAAGDDSTLNTEAIQSAIDQCSINGTVLIPTGIYISGPLFFKSNMTLFLEEGAILKGTTDLSKYPIIEARYEGREENSYASLINGGALCGKGIQNFSIRGKGVIDAEGETLFNLQLEEGKGSRGRILCIMNGENLYFEGVSFLESPAWGVHFIYCNGVTLENIHINTRYNPETKVRYKLRNGDGLAVSSCKNLYLFNSSISSQDDNISLKSGRDEEGRKVGKSTENIRIFDCTFKGGLGVVVGSEMSGNARNILVKDCEYENVKHIAQLKAPWGRGGVIENVIFRNISHRDTLHTDGRWGRGAISIDQYYGAETPDFTDYRPIEENLSSIRDIYFENITLSRKHGYAIYLCGRAEKYPTNINLKNIYAKAPLGLSGRFIDQVTLTGVTIENETGEMLEWVDVNNVTIRSRP